MPLARLALALALGWSFLAATPAKAAPAWTQLLIEADGTQLWVRSPTTASPSPNERILESRSEFGRPGTILGIVARSMGVTYTFRCNTRQFRADPEQYYTGPNLTGSTRRGAAQPWTAAPRNTVIWAVLRHTCASQTPVPSAAGWFKIATTADGFPVWATVPLDFGGSETLIWVSNEFGPTNREFGLPARSSAAVYRVRCATLQFRTDVTVFYAGIGRTGSARRFAGFDDWSTAPAGTIADAIRLAACGVALPAAPRAAPAPARPTPAPPPSGTPEAAVRQNGWTLVYTANWNYGVWTLAPHRTPSTQDEPVLEVRFEYLRPQRIPLFGPDFPFLSMSSVYSVRCSTRQFREGVRTYRKGANGTGLAFRTQSAVDRDWRAASAEPYGAAVVRAACGTQNARSSGRPAQARAPSTPTATPAWRPIFLLLDGSQMYATPPQPSTAYAGVTLLWLKIEHARPVLVGGRAYRSSAGNYEVRCSTRSMRQQATNNFVEPGLRGASVLTPGETAWRTSQTQRDSAIVRAACGEDAD